MLNSASSIYMYTYFQKVLALPILTLNYLIQPLHWIAAEFKLYLKLFFHLFVQVLFMIL